MTDGATLRRRRERLGLSLEAVSAGTRVPLEYLRALEAGEAHRIPPGPYADRYAAAVDALLTRVATQGPVALVSEPMPPSEGPPSLPSVDGEDVTPSEVSVVTRAVPDAPPPQDGIPFPLVRRAAIFALVLAGLFMGWDLLVRWQPWRSVGATGPDQLLVELKVRENARIVVRVDGILREDRVFAGKETAAWRGRERIEVDVPRLDLVSVAFEGRRIDPRGEQDRPRTLTFVNDRARTDGAPP